MELFGALGAWLSRSDNWLGTAGILMRLLEHAYYVGISMLVAGFIAIPLGLLLGRWRRAAVGTINLFNLGRAFPSLGILLLAIVWLGYGDLPVLIALVAMSIPPLLTNTYLGVRQVDPSLHDMASAMGMTYWQRLIHLEIPLAMPFIFTGLRVSLVQLIATATIAAYAGFGGLGRFLIDGLGQRDVAQVMVGGIVVALLAMGSECLLARIQSRFFRLGCQEQATFIGPENGVRDDLPPNIPSLSRGHD